MTDKERMTVERRLPKMKRYRVLVSYYNQQEEHQRELPACEEENTLTAPRGLYGSMNERYR